MGVGLDRHWPKSLSSAVLFVRRPPLNRFRPYVGRSEAGGEDSMRFPMSAYKPGYKKRSQVNGCPMGEHPFDGDIILNKNKNKNNEPNPWESV